MARPAPVPPTSARTLAPTSASNALHRDNQAYQHPTLHQSPIPAPSSAIAQSPASNQIQAPSGSIIDPLLSGTLIGTSFRSAKAPVKRAGTLLHWLQLGKEAAAIKLPPHLRDVVTVVAGNGKAATSGEMPLEKIATSCLVEVPVTDIALIEGEGPMQSPAVAAATTAGAESSSTSVPRVEDSCGVSHVPFAVRLIWVSAEDRRQGLATRLLDAARKHLVPGTVLSYQQLAFVQPTEIGCSFARAYTGCPRFLLC